MLAAALYLEHESLPATRTNPASMKQYSTHDAVPNNSVYYILMFGDNGATMSLLRHCSVESAPMAW